MLIKTIFLKNIINTLYEVSPHWIAVFIDKVVYFIYNLMPRQRKLKREIKRYSEGYYNPKECMYNFLEQIKDVPFYKRIIEKEEIDIKADNIFEEVKKFPILEREDIIKNYDLLVNDSYRGKTIKIGSSGTTATSLVLPYSIDKSLKQSAVWWRYWNNLGIKYGTWMAHFGNKVVVPIEQKHGPYYNIDVLHRTFKFSSFHLTIDSITDYYNNLNICRPTWIHGHAHNIVLFSTLILEKKLQQINYVLHITTGADSLFDWQRSIISEAFPNAIIRQHYGMTEAVTNISENLDGILKVDDDFGYAEFIPFDDDNNESNTCLCKIIGTGFSTLPFPLLRYDTGDLATICTNDDGEKIIKQIDGRTIDSIKLPNGRRISSTSMTNFEYTTKVKEVQFYQKDLYNIYIRIVKREGYGQCDEDEVIRCTRERLPNDVKLHIEYIDKVERTKNGKIRFILSDVK